MRYTTTDGPKKPLNAIQEGSLGDKMGIAGFRLSWDNVLVVSVSVQAFNMTLVALITT